MAFRAGAALPTIEPQEELKVAYSKKAVLGLGPSLSKEREGRRMAGWLQGDSMSPYSLATKGERAVNGLIFLLKICRG
jgi:hypothetical protein